MGYHRTTTLKEFFDLADDVTVCGNFLDAKNVNPIPPVWTVPIFNSTTAWNETMHLRFTQKVMPRTKKELSLVPEEAVPTSIQTPTWTSLGWRLVTHPGFLTLAHHDCCGMGTYVIGNAGCKLWAVLRPKKTECNASNDTLRDVFEHALDLTDGTYRHADMATVCLEEGDIM
jgi:hypothetical protein